LAGGLVAWLLLHGGSTPGPNGQSGGPSPTPSGSQPTSPPSVQPAAWSRVTGSKALGGPGDQWMQKAIEGGPGLIAVGAASNGSDDDAAIWTSTDGVRWQRATGSDP